MKIIAVNTQDGGTGKTTTADNLADYLSRYGTTIIVDGDLSGSTTRFFTSDFQTGRKLEIAPENELASVFRNLPVSPIEVRPNLDLLAGSSELYDVIQELSIQNKGLTTFRNWVRRSKLSEIYDYIVIDTHNDKSVITKSLLLASDMVLGVVKPDQFSLDGYSKLKKIASELRDDMDLVDDNDNPYMTDSIHYIVNCANFSKTTTKELLAYIDSPKQYLKDHEEASLFDLSTLPSVKEYLGYFNENTIFNKALLSNRTVIDMADTGTYRRKRYLPFFENFKETLDNIKGQLDQ